MGMGPGGRGQDRLPRVPGAEEPPSSTGAAPQQPVSGPRVHGLVTPTSSHDPRLLSSLPGGDAGDTDICPRCLSMGVCLPVTHGSPSSPGAATRPLNVPSRLVGTRPTGARGRSSRVRQHPVSWPSGTAPQAVSCAPKGQAHWETQLLLSSPQRALGLERPQLFSAPDRGLQLEAGGGSLRGRGVWGCGGKDCRGPGGRGSTWIWFYFSKTIGDHRTHRAGRRAAV